MVAEGEAECRISAIRVGTDLVQIPDVQASIDEFGDRYLRRVYSPGELATCVSSDGRAHAARLATRFAAKESVIKALRPRVGVDYRNIEVTLDHFGSPSITFHGTAVDALAAHSITSESLSVTHEASFAAAVYVAVLDAAPQRAVSNGAAISTPGQNHDRSN